jgi:transcriptional regulator NrdR family protein
MKCPVCNAWTLVKQTKNSPTFGHVRRRECANEHRFTTREVAIPKRRLTKREEQISLITANNWNPFERANPNVLNELAQEFTKQRINNYGEALL